MVARTFQKALALILCGVALLQPKNVAALGLLPAYEAALTNDPVYRSAQRDHESGQQLKELGRSHLLPNVSATYSRNRNQADITNSSGRGEVTERRNYTGLVASLQVRQPLYHPEGQARYRQGLAQTQASNAQFSSRSQELIVRLVSLYTPAKYAEDQLAQAIAQRDAYAEQRLSNVRLFQRGEGTVTDVLEAQARFDLAEAQVLEARDNVLNTRNALAAMVGRDINKLEPLTDDFRVRPMLPETFEAWKELALVNNPELQAQRHGVDAAREEIDKNQAGHAPRLDLVASTGTNSSDTTNTFNQSSKVHTLGVQLNVPIYSGGAVTAATRQAISNHGKAQADLDVKTNTVVLELRKQYHLTLSGVLRIEAAAKALGSASLLVEATRKSVMGGQRTYLDVLNAQQQLFEARRDLALARYNYLLSYLRLRYAAGTLSAADLTDIAGYFVASP